MDTSIKDRLSKVPPFEDDIPMIKEVKEIAKGQTKPSQIQETNDEEVVEEPEKVEDEKINEPEPVQETPEEEKQEEAPKVSERTAEQINKLTTHNKELKEENKKLYKNVLESLKPQATQEFTPQVHKQIETATTDMTQTQVDDVFANLISKDEYGNPVIDPDLLIKTLKESNEEAKRARLEAEEARKEANIARQETKRTKQDFEETAEVRQVHRKYPQINPKNEAFNEMFWDDVRKEIATAPILKGQTVSFMEAADKIWNDRYANIKEVEEVNKKEKQQVKEVEDAKRNINASVPTGRSSEYYSKADIEDLKNATMSGKRGALAERLRRAGQ